MGSVGSLIQGRMTSKVSSSHHSFASTFGRSISCGQTSHRLITMLIHGKITCPFLRWYLHCHLSEPLVGNVNGSFESWKTIKSSWLFSHWILKFQGNCVGLNGRLRTVPKCSFAQDGKEREKLEERNGLSISYFYRALWAPSTWSSMMNCFVKKAARRKYCLHSLDKRIEGR